MTWRDSTHAHAKWKWLDEITEEGCHNIPVVVSVGMVMQDDDVAQIGVSISDQNCESKSGAGKT